MVAMILLLQLPLQLFLQSWRTEVLTMLVMDAVGAGEDVFPLCPGAGDLVTRCCLLKNRKLEVVLLMAQNESQACQ